MQVLSANITNVHELPESHPRYIAAKKRGVISLAHIDIQGGRREHAKKTQKEKVTRAIASAKASKNFVVGQQVRDGRNNLATIVAVDEAFITVDCGGSIKKYLPTKIKAA